ncbi:hypothetical protein [Shimia sagamensis]|uniref:G domain-containing protein n=1 Tax=Shimia sagamensis TaxID=1566352 RepID=A0ABY1PEM2_9RHOB|nr:hypothetical protein [Shimia sagamensis]SMP31018.1 hypothetical protein SAMN06265373_107186 [Shimia sagamensis]
MRTQPDQIVGQLHSVLSSGQVPRRQKDLGAEILSHLSQAVRVVVLGRPGSGKTSLINMMLGQEVVHAHKAVDVVEVVYGVAARVTAHLSDGTTHTFAGHSLDGQDCGDIQRLTYEVPLESLKTLAFCEVAQPNDVPHQQALLETALQEGQVLVWCSEGFDQVERTIWQSVPDAIKDHSFLALTKADRQIMKGDLGAQIAALEETAAQEFLGLHPIATLHALKARAGGEAQAALWQASGGQELVAAVEAQVRKGRAADLDQARVLLAQLGEVVEASTQESVQTPAHQTSPSSASTTDTQAALLDQLQAHLQSAAQEMLSDLDDGKIPNSEGLLTRCASTVRALTSLLAADAGQEMDATGLLEDAQDGEETLMLLQVEQSPSAAEDAVILLLQLRKEIGARAQA